MVTPTSVPTGRGRPLSRREVQVLELARLGLTNARIGERLDVSVHTVKFHLASVYRKLGAANRTEAIVRWLAASTAQEKGVR